MSLHRKVVLADGFRVYARPKAKQRRGCQRKVRYATQEEAQKNASFFGLNVYRCPVCSHWHCTKEEQRTLLGRRL